MSLEAGAWLADWDEFDDLLDHPRVGDALGYIARQPGIAPEGRR